MNASAMAAAGSGGGEFSSINFIAESTRRLINVNLITGNSVLEILAPDERVARLFFYFPIAAQSCTYVVIYLYKNLTLPSRMLEME